MSDRWRGVLTRRSSARGCLAGRRCEYEWEYGPVSATCISLYFVAALDWPTCRRFQLSAVRRSCSSRTFNPKVAGSSPARPIIEELQSPFWRLRIGALARRSTSAPRSSPSALAALSLLFVAPRSRLRTLRELGLRTSWLVSGRAVRLAEQMSGQTSSYEPRLGHSSVRACRGSRWVRGLCVCAKGRARRSRCGGRDPRGRRGHRGSLGKDRTSLWSPKGLRAFMPRSASA